MQGRSPSFLVSATTCCSLETESTQTMEQIALIAPCLRIHEMDRYLHDLYWNLNVPLTFY